MANKTFNKLEDHELYSVVEMCKAIENKRVVLVCSDKRWKMIVPSCESGYPYDYTYNLMRWGFATKARNSDHHARLHPYCPNQDMSATLARFINTAVEMGYYVRQTTKAINGGDDYNTIWM